jgi:hypothetical protein
LFEALLGQAGPTRRLRFDALGNERRRLRLSAPIGSLIGLGQHLPNACVLRR